MISFKNKILPLHIKMFNYEKIFQTFFIVISHDIYLHFMRKRMYMQKP